jgi:CBS domain-containing protein
MTPEPVSIRADATLREAIALLVDRRISATPVVDNRGVAIGVISRTDLVEYDRENVARAQPTPEYYTRRELNQAAGETLPRGFQVEQVDRTRVREIMTPVIHAVRPETSAAEVVRRIVALDVHRLFVTEETGQLLGVITTMDIICNLLPNQALDTEAFHRLASRLDDAY